MELTSNRPSPPSTIRIITIRDERRLFDKRVVVLRAIFFVKKKKRRGKDRRWRVHDGRAEQRSGRGMGWSRSSSLDRFSILPPGHRKYCLFGEIATIPLFTEWCYRIWARHISVQTCVHIERERERDERKRHSTGRESNRCSIFLRQRFGETIGGNDFPRFQRNLVNILNILLSTSLSLS